MKAQKGGRDRCAQSQNLGEQPVFLTIDEVAELRRVSSVTVRRWISAGAMPYEQPSGKGGAIRIRREDAMAHASQPDQQTLPEQKQKTRGSRPHWMKDIDHGQAA